MTQRELHQETGVGDVKIDPSIAALKAELQAKCAELAETRSEAIRVTKEQSDAIGALRAQVERLTRERDDAEKLCESLQNRLATRPVMEAASVAERDALRAEVERLSEHIAEALWLLALAEPNVRLMRSVTEQEWLNRRAKWSVEIARAALAAEQPAGDKP